MKDINDLIVKASNFIFDQGEISSEIEASKDFLIAFPEPDIKNIAIDDYVLGANNNSFCWWIEFGKLSGGCGGGSANKHGIYKDVHGKYVVGTKSKKQFYDLGDSELEKIFNEIKQSIIKGIDCFRNKKFKELDDVQKSSKIWQFVFLKILYTYINDELIPISSLDLLLELCNILKLSYDGQANIFEINNKVCIELKKI